MPTFTLNGLRPGSYVEVMDTTRDRFLFQENVHETALALEFLIPDGQHRSQLSIHIEMRGYEDVTFTEMVGIAGKSIFIEQEVVPRGRRKRERRRAIYTNQSG